MTIEEMIERLKNDAKESRKAALSCARANDYETASRWKTLGYLHEQIAEWLIELKRRREADIAEQPKTNGDKIRAMTDEELADWLTDGHDKCDICKLCSFGACRIESECEKGVLEWLKQERELICN